MERAEMVKRVAEMAGVPIGQGEKLLVDLEAAFEMLRHVFERAFEVLRQALRALTLAVMPRELDEVLRRLRSDLARVVDDPPRPRLPSRTECIRAHGVWFGRPMQRNAWAWRRM